MQRKGLEGPCMGNEARLCPVCSCPCASPGVRACGSGSQGKFVSALFLPHPAQACPTLNSGPRAYGASNFGESRPMPEKEGRSPAPPAAGGSSPAAPSTLHRHPIEWHRRGREDPGAGARAALFCVVGEAWAPRRHSAVVNSSPTYSCRFLEP